MKIIYLRLKGYAGIYNGLGLNELEIDLSNSQHKIIVITGINGCGKTTLLKAASLLPDGSSDFIANVPAEKEIHLLDGNNLYQIKISSAAAKNGTRGLSKASIMKNGIELNPNGNIGSYKEIIFQEFDLDSNFITLSRLSGDDRGLADKSPAERKKFMSFIVESLETYNALYKNLNKKSSIFKSYVSNLHTKIQNVGDEENLRSTMSSLEMRRDNLKASIESLKNAIVESQTILAMNDPNGTMQAQYESSEQLVKDLKGSVDLAFKEFSRLCRELSIEPTIEAVLNFSQTRTGMIETHQHNLEESERKKTSLMEKRETALASIGSKQQKIDELSKGVDPNLTQTITALRNKLINEEVVLKQIGVLDPDNTSKEELEFTFNTIQSIVDMIWYQLYTDMTDTMMEAVLTFSKGDLARFDREMKKQSNLVSRLTDETKDIQRDAEIINILSNRPKGCKIDDCYFISTAYKLQNDKYKGVRIDKAIKESSIALAEAVKTEATMADQYEAMCIVAQKRDILDHIRSLIELNKGILQKCTIGKLLVDTFEKRIRQMNSFNEFRDLDDLISKINTITIYKQDASSLKQLESAWMAQSNSESMINELSHEVEVLQEQLTSINKELQTVSNEIYSHLNLLERLNKEQQVATRAKEKGDIWIDENMRLSEAQTKFDEIIKKSKASIAILEKITSMNVELGQLQSQVQPLEDQISRINGQLVMLESYKAEYTMYHEKYNMVDTLKKYCSPTSGIQTVFMSIYMNKTLELANQVLSLVFGDQYRILDYIINSNEFRIPFIGSGMMVDDISSGSTSQVCMMGMAMNLVLLYQASTRYNITRLDEIDGGLDTRNRLEFVNALYKIIDILNIDQLFIISHSLELELTNVDMIKLKTYEGYDIPEGNVLYDFKSSTLR